MYEISKTTQTDNTKSQAYFYNYTNLYPHTENNKNDMPKYTHKNMPPRTTANPLPTPTSVAYIPSNRYEKKYRFC